MSKPDVAAIQGAPPLTLSPHRGEDLLTACNLWVLPGTGQTSDETRTGGRRQDATTSDTERDHPEPRGLPVRGTEAALVGERTTAEQLLDVARHVGEGPAARTSARLNPDRPQWKSGRAASMPDSTNLCGVRAPAFVLYRKCDVRDRPLGGVSALLFVGADHPDCLTRVTDHPRLCGPCTWRQGLRCRHQDLKANGGPGLVVRLSPGPPGPLGIICNRDGCRNLLHDRTALRCAGRRTLRLVDDLPQGDP